MNDPSRPWLSLLVALVGGACAGVLLAASLHWGKILGTLNSHAVIPGQVYRSAQPGPREVDWLVRKYHIRTIINLRGNGAQFAWYRNEAVATAEHNLSQEDILMSACRLPSPQAVRQLIEALDRSPGPILLHCQQGVDRTGLASAIALLLYTDTPLDEACRSMSLAYGHVPLFRTRFIGGFFRQYRDWLADLERVHKPILFRVWATKYYRPAEAEWVAPDGPVSVVGGHRKLVMARVRNTSDQTWQFRADPGVGLHVMWYFFAEDGSLVTGGPTGRRDADVPPGETFEVPIVLPRLLPKGRYRLQAELVRPEQTTYAQLGSSPLDVEVIVP
jgi:protein tyrosine/serine phosphatase